MAAQRSYSEVSMDAHEQLPTTAEDTLELFGQRFVGVRAMYLICKHCCRSRRCGGGCCVECGELAKALRRRLPRR